MSEKQLLDPSRRCSVVSQRTTQRHTTSLRRGQRWKQGELFTFMVNDKTESSQDLE